MYLKKSVCKACRIQAFGQAGWNEFAEAWFDPIPGNRRGDTVCPFTITDQMVANIGQQIKDKIVLTQAMKTAIKQGGLSIRVKVSDMLTWHTDSVISPPPWCPFPEYHKMKGVHKLPKRVPFTDLNKDKGKYPKGTTFWHGVPLAQ